MQALKLDLLRYSQELRLSNRGGQRMVFDPVRKANFLLTKEEFVRQLFIRYLMDQQGVSPGRIAVERKINTAKMDKRFDLLVFDKEARALMVIECKAADVPMDQKVLDQAGIYNEVLQAQYLVVTNGITTFVYRIDHLAREVKDLAEFPPL